MKKLLLFLPIFLLLATPIYAWELQDVTPINPVYRAYNPVTGAHYLTINPTAYDWYINLFGWNGEGIAWFTMKGGPYIYDVYNQYTEDHLYTLNTNEANYLNSLEGWSILEEEGFWGNGPTPVYRLYAPNALKHLYTTDLNEYNILPAYGWQQEGIAFNVYSAEEAEPYY